MECTNTMHKLLCQLILNTSKLLYYGLYGMFFSSEINDNDIQRTRMFVFMFMYEYMYCVHLCNWLSFANNSKLRIRDLRPVHTLPQAAARRPHAVAFILPRSTQVKLLGIQWNCWEFHCTISGNVGKVELSATCCLRQSMKQSSQLTHSTFRAACGKVWTGL